MSKKLLIVCAIVFIIVVNVILLQMDKNQVIAAIASTSDLQDNSFKGNTVQNIETSILPDIPLSSIENHIENDRGIFLGSVGSDLWHMPGDPMNRFWMVSDRGPNSNIKVKGKKRRTFCVPTFTPVILQVELDGPKIEVLKTIPLVDSNGVPVGGVSNIKKIDEKPFDYRGKEPIPYDQNGVDCEGVVRTSDGNFWLSEEYSPSLVRCDSEGKILKRYVPIGLQLEKTRYPVVACLPNILLKHKKNRGLEGLTISHDEKTLYAVMQSALYNPNEKVGSDSRNVRLLVFDIASEKTIAEYVYRVEPFTTYGAGAKKVTDVKISGLAMLDKTSMLVLERTDEVARLYKIDLNGADNILDSKWDKISTSPSLEAVNDFSSVDVTPLPKTLVANLGQVENVPEKIEGIAVLDSKTIAVANDNDFDLGSFSPDGRNQGADIKSVICILKFDAPLGK